MTRQNQIVIAVPLTAAHTQPNVTSRAFFVNPKNAGIWRQDKVLPGCMSGRSDLRRGQKCTNAVDIWL